MVSTLGAREERRGMTRNDTLNHFYLKSGHSRVLIIWEDYSRNLDQVNSRHHALNAF